MEGPVGAGGRPVLSHSTFQSKQIQYPLLCQIASLIFIDRRPVPDVNIGCGPALSSKSKMQLPLPFSVSFLQSTRASIQKRRLLMHMNSPCREQHCRQPWPPACVRTYAQSNRCPRCPDYMQQPFTICHWP